VSAAGAPRTRSPWALYAALTLAVWGLFALDRGLWHDEVQILFRALAAPARGEGLFLAIASPTRRLLAWPSFLALASGHPRLALELLAGLSWLATGVLAERLARRLWPGERRAPCLAAVLTLVATPDFFTNALVGLGYQLAIVAYLAAACAGLVWLQEGGRAWLVTACAALAASLWTGDAALPAFLLTPLLWAVAPRPADAGARGRRRALLWLWYAVALPYVAVLAQALRAPGSYVQSALVPLGWGERAVRVAELSAWNFESWGWALARPLWLPSAGHVIPLGVQLTLAALAGIGAALWLFGRRDATAPSNALGARRPWRGVLVALLLMVASNAAFAGVHLAQFFCRTHLLSRVFAGLALAGALAWAWDRGAGRPAPRAALAAAVALWTGLGVAGGLERQDYYAAYARRHRQELRSLLAAAAGLTPDARLLLRVPGAERYLATEAGYLARAWTALLYQDPRVECRVFLWSTPRGTRCTPRPEGLECRGERSPDCRRVDGRDFELLPYERLVFLEYEPAENRYALRRTLPAEATPAATAPGARYAPEANLVERPLTPLARDLIDGPEGPAAWLWPAR
jgi:hypothetical protein